MKLPFLVSVPHAGLTVPPEIRDLFLLSAEEILVDSDEGAGDIYDIADNVEVFISTHVARSVIDLNRAENDFSQDGVIKTVSCQMDRVYSAAPSRAVLDVLIEKYYRPYHKRLREKTTAHRNSCLLALDCHTMLEISPGVSGTPGLKRPYVCLSHSPGISPGKNSGTCPDAWIETMKDCFKNHFGTSVKINDPFKGGYIIRSHSKEMPWIQVEISREPFCSIAEKKDKFLASLQDWVDSGVFTL